MFVCDRSRHPIPSISRISGVTIHCHPPIMKLNITLLSVTLATAGCCSAFALSPGRHAPTSNRVGSGGGFDNKAAFVRPDATPFTSSAMTATTLHSTSASTEGDSSSSVQTTRGGAAAAPFGIDVPLLAYFGLWYLGNYYYNITNKLALKAVGGASGFPLTISTLQLGIGSLYGLFLWLAPDAREKPKITLDDVSTYYINNNNNLFAVVHCLTLSSHRCDRHKQSHTRQLSCDTFSHHFPSSSFFYSSHHFYALYSIDRHRLSKCSP